MTTASDVKLTQQDEELAAHGDLVAVVPCDATGVLFDATNRLYTRGTYRQVDAQWDPFIALLLEINDNLIAIRDRTGGNVTPVLAPLPGNERTVLTCTAGRPDVDVFVVAPEGGQGALDLGDPALCPGQRVAIVSGEDAVPLSLFWTIPDWPATLTWGADVTTALGVRGNLDFDGDPFTVTFSDDGVTKTHTVDTDYPASLAGLNQLMTEMFTAIGGTFRQRSFQTGYFGLGSSAATGTGAELTITSVSDGDPLDLASGTPEDGWPGAVFAVDGGGGALDWEYPEYGVSDYRPPPTGGGIHTHPDDRSPHTRGVELLAVPASLNGGVAKWSALGYPVRTEDL